MYTAMGVDILRAQLTETIQRTPSIRSFRFVPEKRIAFFPGQFACVMFNPDDAKDTVRNKYLSFSSSPNNEYIEFTKRISESEFSKHLLELQKAEVVTLKAPMGTCVYKNEYKNIVFLVGGIGITPVISILEYIAQRKLDVESILFYSNREEREIAFRSKLDALGGEINLKTYYTITHCIPQGAACIPGRITKEILLDKVGGWCNRQVYIFGPPKMVAAMEELTTYVQCKKEHVLTESFVGYK